MDSQNDSYSEKEKKPKSGKGLRLIASWNEDGEEYGVTLTNGRLAKRFRPVWRIAVLILVLLLGSEVLGPDRMRKLLEFLMP